MKSIDKKGMIIRIMRMDGFALWKKDKKTKVFTITEIAGKIKANTDLTKRYFEELEKEGKIQIVFTSNMTNYWGLVK